VVIHVHAEIGGGVFGVVEVEFVEITAVSIILYN
jgi:UDP-3-O-[3-hydroxymyristoyl] glucosamine N-acyltransferase